jgi:hypothetical protein
LICGDINDDKNYIWWENIEIKFSWKVGGWGGGEDDL